MNNSQDDHLPSQVLKIGSPLTVDDVDTYLKVRDADDKSYKLRVIVDAWKHQQTEDRRMRRGYAWGLLSIVALQVLVINGAFFLIGFGVITVEPSVLKYFFVSVFGEIAAMTLVILKYLFPKIGTEL